MTTKNWMPREKLLSHISAVLRGVSPRLDLVTKFGSERRLCKVYRLNQHVVRIDVVPIKEKKHGPIKGRKGPEKTSD